MSRIHRQTVVPFRAAARVFAPFYTSSSYILCRDRSSVFRGGECANGRERRADPAPVGAASGDKGAQKKGPTLASLSAVDTAIIRDNADERDILRPLVNPVTLQLLDTTRGNTPAGDITCAPPPAGMVSWWSLENNADDIYGTNNGTLQNSPPFVAGEVGQAMSVNGTNGISVPTSPSLNFGAGADFSIDAWIRTSNTTRPSFDHS